MRHSLLESIRQENDLTSAIVLTHNIDFSFFQLMALPIFKAAGHPKLTIFADAHCAAQTYESQAPIVSGIGVSYRVVPILMTAGFRFHPKAVLLSGPERARLFIGSGNLTFGGWVENGEVWVEFASDIDGTAQLAWFRQYLNRVAEKVKFAEPIRAEIEEAFEPGNHRWAVEMQEPEGLVGRVAGEPPLLEQMAAIAGSVPTDHLTVCSPFFDDSAEALRQLATRFEVSKTTVFVQNGKSGLTTGAASGLPSSIQPVAVAFQRQNTEGTGRESYLHAKYYAFEQNGAVTIFSGSANCSRAALLVPGAGGNAELMAVQTLATEAYQQNFTSEFQLLDSPPQLVETPEEKTAADCTPVILITVARWEEGELLLGFQCPEGVSPKRCVVDDAPVDFQILSEGQALVYCGRPPRFVRMEGVAGGVTVSSNLMWIDQERELRSTARGRMLGATIRRKAREGNWGIRAWTEIFDVLCKHLQYTPAAGNWRSPPKRRAKDEGAIIYTEEDVFSNQYGLGTFASPATKTINSFGFSTIQRIFLKWFDCTDEGQQDPIKDENFEDENEPISDGTGSQQNGSEEPVDKPTRLGPRKKPLTLVEPTRSDRERISQFMDKLAETICRPEYLEQRPPDMLASDLKRVSVLLLTMLHQGWTSLDDFSRCSRKIWSRLFLTSEKDPTLGWLPYRKQNCEDPAAFARCLSSTELSAALAGWAFRLPLDFISVERAVFSLSQIVSVSKMPEIWHGASLDEISEKLAGDVLPLLSDRRPEDEVFEDLRKRWLLMIRMGRAIQVFEKALEGREALDLKVGLGWRVLPAGELLWQGTNGFCITPQPVDRKRKRPVMVVSLRDTKRPIQFVADYLTPLRLLVKDAALFQGTEFGEAHRRYLLALSTTVKKHVAAAHESGLPWGDFGSHG